MVNNIFTKRAIESWFDTLEALSLGRQPTEARPNPYLQISSSNLLPVPSNPSSPTLPVSQLFFELIFQGNHISKTNSPQLQCTAGFKISTSYPWRICSA